MEDEDFDITMLTQPIVLCVYDEYGQCGNGTNTLSP